MEIYDKLIRDKIPEIIALSGKECRVRTLHDGEYIKYLNKKLQEELDEYYESGDIEELADIMEIVFAILKYKNVAPEAFERLRMSKRETRGGFEKKLLLLSVHG